MFLVNVRTIRRKSKKKLNNFSLKDMINKLNRTKNFRFLSTNYRCSVLVNVI